MHDLDLGHVLVDVFVEFLVSLLQNSQLLIGTLLAEFLVVVGLGV